MNFRNRWIVLGSVALLIVSIEGCSSDDSTSEKTRSIQSTLTKESAEAALRAAAGCSDCSVLGYADISLPLTQRHIIHGKVLTKDKNIELIALDENSRTVDIDALVSAESGAIFARQGHLRDELYALSQSNTTETIPIWILSDYHDTSPRREDLIADPKLEDADATARAMALRSAAAPIVAWLEAHQYKIGDRGDRTPIITADVPASALTILGKLPGIAVVGLREAPRPNSLAWFDTVNAGSVQSTIPSTSTPFCMKELYQPDSYANLIVPSANIAAPTGTSGEHATWTTELIASTGPYRMAPSAPTYIANMTGSGGINLDEWCWSRARNLNFSYGSSSGVPGDLSAQDIRFDYYTKHSPYPLITVTAGNDGDFAGYDTVVNRGYNVLIVGASDDKGTTNPSDDTIAGFSSWRNPPSLHKDREAPAIVAPGVSISSASYTKSGTSASAPIALGAGLMAFQQDSRYSSWPEMARATYIAASYRPVDGTVVHLSSGASGPDLKQGAGMLDAQRLTGIAEASNWVAPGSPMKLFGHFAKTYVFASDFDTNGLSYDTFTIGGFVGMKMSVAIAWDGTAVGCDPTDPTTCGGVKLDADLDLHIYDPYGNLICSSASFDSSWEMCNFPLTYTNYTAQIRRSTTTSTSTYLGIAWSVHN